MPVELDNGVNFNSMRYLFNCGELTEVQDFFKNSTKFALIDNTKVKSR